MRRSGKSRHWLLGSMSSNMRRVATVLCALTLTITVVFSGLLYRVGTTVPVCQPIVVTADASVGNDALLASESTEQPALGTELIGDEDVPLAAPVAQQAEQPGASVPVHLVLGFALGFVVVFLAVDIYRVNANIDKMHKKTR